MRKKSGRTRPSLRRYPLLFFIIPLAVIIGWLIYFDYQDTENELKKLLVENASALIDSYSKTIQDNQQAFDAIRKELVRRLLSDAKFLAYLDTRQNLNSEFLKDFASTHGLFRINIFDSSGQKELSSHHDMSTKRSKSGRLSELLLPLIDGTVSELVVGLTESRYGDQTRFIVAVGRENGGAIVVNVQGDLLDRQRREMGLGRTLSEMTAHDSIVFAIIQDEEGPISVSPRLDSLAALDSDSFLSRVFDENQTGTRFTTYQGEDVLEAVTPIFIDVDYRALLRVGLDLSFYNDNLSTLAQRDVALGIGFFLGGGLLLGLVYFAQNYRFLHSRFMQSLAMADHITENMQEAMVVLNRDGMVIRLNRRAAELFDLKEGAPLDQRLSESVKESSSPDSDRESSYLKWDDKTFLTLWEELPGVDSGSQNETLLMFLDVTRQREAEEKLRREEKLAALGRLIAGVAHEIRNPLNALSISIQNLIRRLQNTRDPKTLKSLNIIREEISRLNELVENFLIYARPVDPKPSPVLLAPMIEKIREIFSAELTQRTIQLQIDFADISSTTSILVDEVRFQQVLMNIIRNSLEAMDDGGRIHVQTTRDNGHLVLRFRDSGPGFSEEVLSRALEPFHTTKERGTGLGLSLCDDIIRRHGWLFEVGNHPEGGAQVMIIIPDKDVT